MVRGTSQTVKREFVNRIRLARVDSFALNPHETAVQNATHIPVVIGSALIALDFGQVDGPSRVWQSTAAPGEVAPGQVTPSTMGDHRNPANQDPRKERGCWANRSQK
jgi:hypothetical protein